MLLLGLWAIMNWSMLGEPVNGDPKAALAQAKATGKPALLVFTSPQSCPPCARMENSTWPDPKLTTFVNANTVMVKINPSDPDNATIVQHYGLRGVPTLVITDPMGNEINRAVGGMNAQQVMDFVKHTLSMASATAPASDGS